LLQNASFRIVCLWLLWVIFLPAGPVIARAQSNTLQLNFTGNTQAVIQAGGVFTGQVLITNTAEQPQSVHDELLLPEHWRHVLAPEATFSLKPGEAYSRLIAFSVPASAIADTYQVAYQTVNAQDSTLAGRVELRVVVLPKVEINWFAIDVPAYAVGGEPYDIPLRIENLGNVHTPVKISARGTPQTRITFTPETVELDAGVVDTVTLQVQTDPDLPNQLRQEINIQITTPALAGERITQSKTFFINVIPRNPKSVTPYYRLPVQIRMTTAMDKDQIRPQVEVSGSGSLQEGGENRVDFLFRGPDARYVRYYSQREEYRLGYQQGPFALQLGDRFYSLSILTDRYRYGRGLSFNYNFNHSEVGVYYLRNLYQHPMQTNLAAYIHRQVSQKIAIQGNLLNRWLGEKGGSDQIFSLESMISPWTNTTLEAEYGQGIQNKQFTDGAYRLELKGKTIHQVSFDLGGIYAGTGYSGYYKDIIYNRGTVEIPINKSMNFHLLYRSITRGLQPEKMHTVATRNREYRSGMSYLFPFGVWFNLQYQYFAYRFSPPDGAGFDNRLNTAILDAFYRKGQWQLNTRAEVGIRRDALLEESQLFRRFRVGTAYYPTNNQEYNVYVERGNDMYSPLQSHTTTLRLSGVWRLNERIRGMVNYVWSRYEASQPWDRNDWLCNVTYMLPGRGSLELSARYIRTPLGNDLAGHVTYSLPIGVPVAKKRNISSLKGVVFHSMGTRQEPLRGVLVDVGTQQAITNTDGMFLFPALTANTYLLRIDRTSLGFDRIPVQPMPLPVSLQPGEEKDLEIEITAPAGIHGRVVVPERDSTRIHQGGGKLLLGPENAESTGRVAAQQVETLAAGVSGVMLEISRDGKAYRTTTNLLGRFAFDELRPGEWTLAVEERSLPDGYTLDQKSYQVALSPGKQEQLDIYIYPQYREIQILEQGEIK